MVVERYAEHLRDRVERVLGVAGQQRPGDPQSIDRCERAVQSQSPAVLSHKAYVKGHVVARQNAPFGESEELRQYLLDRVRVDDHLIRDACQLLDPVGDRNVRVDELGEPACDLAVLYFDGAKFDDPVLFR